MLKKPGWLLYLHQPPEQVWWVPGVGWDLQTRCSAANLLQLSLELRFCDKLLTVHFLSGVFCHRRELFTPTSALLVSVPPDHSSSPVVDQTSS